MPMTTWKIMLRRAGQAGYHYTGTQQVARAPIIGDEGKATVDGQEIRWKATEVYKDLTPRSDAEVFTVRVDEITSAQ